MARRPPRAPAEPIARVVAPMEGTPYSRAKLSSRVLWPITRVVAANTSSPTLVPVRLAYDNSWAAAGPLATQSSFEISGAQTFFDFADFTQKSKENRKSTNRLVFAIANYFSR